MKMWNDPNPIRRRRNRLIVLYIAVFCGSFLLSVIARMVGFSDDAATYLLFPAAFLLGMLLPFVFWMVALTRRAKAWEKDQRALAEARETQEQLKRELRAQGKPPLEKPQGREASGNPVTAEQVIQMESERREAQAQHETKHIGKIALAFLALGLIGLILYVCGMTEIGLVPMVLGLGAAPVFGLVWLLERGTLRRNQKERKFLEQGGSFEELLRRRNREDALLLVALWIAALALFLLNAHFRSLGNENATQATNVGLLVALMLAGSMTFLMIESAWKDRKERRKREQQHEAPGKSDAPRFVSEQQPASLGESDGTSSIPKQQPEAPGELDDMSYIKEMRHSTSGPWQQYDVVLDARPYGWEYMVDEVDELAKADLDNVSTLKSAAAPGAPEEELIYDYEAAGNRAAGIAQLANERATLIIGGFSRTLDGPVMVVLFNQTNLLRFFVIFRNEERVRRYAETLIRRSFNTPDAMKLGRPHAEVK